AHPGARGADELRASAHAAAEAGARRWYRVGLRFFRFVRSSERVADRRLARVPAPAGELARAPHGGAAFRSDARRSRARCRSGVAADRAAHRAAVLLRGAGGGTARDAGAGLVGAVAQSPVLRADRTSSAR